MRPNVVPPAPNVPPLAPVPNNVMSVRMFCRWKSPSSRPARMVPHEPPNVRYTSRMSICAPKLSCRLLLLICGANPKCTLRSRLPSLPAASKFAKPGNKPVRMRVTRSGFTRPPSIGPNAESTLPFVYTRNAFTLPVNVNDHPLLICIVRPCARAVLTPANIRAIHQSADRFIATSPSRVLSVLPNRGELAFTDSLKSTHKAFPMAPPLRAIAARREMNLCGPTSRCAERDRIAAIDAVDRLTIPHLTIDRDHHIHDRNLPMVLPPVEIIDLCRIHLWRIRKSELLLVLEPRDRAARDRAAVERVARQDRQRAGLLGPRTRDESTQV